MADWEHDDQGRRGPREPSLEAGRDWRGGRDGRYNHDRGLLESRYGGPVDRPEPRAFDEDRLRDHGDRGVRQPRDPRSAGHSRDAAPGRSTGGGRTDQEGGDTAYGQMASGSSDSGLGGYGGANVGGWGQPNLNSQWGQGGYGPLNQGLDYGQDGGSFTPVGYDASAYGPSPRQGPGGRRTAEDQPHDPHHASYHHWRNTQLSSHDRDYARWREEQARRYDEDYGSWRNERHSAFSKEFEGWRAGRGGQAGASASVGEQGGAHGANPTLARIADGETGRPHHDVVDKADPDRDPARH